MTEVVAPEVGGGERDKGLRAVLAEAVTAFQRNMCLVKPFEPAPEVDYTEADLTQHPLWGFRDPKARADFLRFLHRDFATLMPELMYSGGCLIYPLTNILSLERYIPMYLVFAALLLLLATYNIVTYFLFENTAQIARWRSRVAVMTMLCITATTSWAMFEGYARCDMADILQRSYTPEVQRRTCVENIIPFGLVTVLVTLSAIHLDPPFIVTAFCLDFALASLSRYVMLPTNPETSRQYCVKAIIWVFMYTAGFTVQFLRYRSSISQFTETVKAKKEMDVSKKREEQLDQLLVAMLPASALARLSLNQVVFDYASSATVLFSDIVQFTAWSKKRTAIDVVQMLNVLCRRFDTLAAEAKVEKVKTIGDAYWAVTGLPESADDHAERMCDFAVQMLDAVEHSNRKHREWDNIQIRVGISSGSLSGGILGTQQLSYEVFGSTSHLAEEVEKNGVPSRAAISDRTLRCLPAEIAESSILGAPVKTFSFEDESCQMYLLKVGKTIGQLLADAPKADLMSRSELSQSSAKRSRRSEISALSEADLRAKRREFLEKKALAARSAKQSASEVPEAAEDGASRMSIEQKYSARKYNWVYLDSNDPSIELEYRRFVREMQLTVRRASRLLMIIIATVLLISVPIEGRAFSTSSIVVFCITIAAGCGNSVLAFRDLHPTVDVLFHHAVAALLIVACGLLPRAIAGNDVSYLNSAMMLLLSIGNLGLASAPTLLALLSTCLFAPALYFAHHSVTFGVDILFVLQQVVVIGFILFIMERLYRRQFVDRQLAKHFILQQGARNSEQAALLASIVPHHVIPELMESIAGSYQDRSIVKSYDNVCVAFIKLLPESELPLHGVRELSSQVSVVQNARPSSEPSVDALDADLDGLRRTSTEIEAGEVESRFAWLLPAHEEADDALKLFSALDKIKTIGDLLLLAGPFRPDISLYQAVDEMVAAVSVLEKRRQRRLQVGMHVGVVVGAVIGTDRLCFDIFGDTVNTASRSMTAGSAGDIIATERFVETFQQSLGIDSTNSPADAAGAGAPSHSGRYLPPQFVDDLEGSADTDVGVGPQIRPTKDGLRREQCCGRDAVWSQNVQKAAKGLGSIDLRFLVTCPTVRREQDLALRVPTRHSIVVVPSTEM